MSKLAYKTTPIEAVYRCTTNKSATNINLKGFLVIISPYVEPLTLICRGQPQQRQQHHHRNSQHLPPSPTQPVWRYVIIQEIPRVIVLQEWCKISMETKLPWPFRQNVFVQFIVVAEVPLQSFVGNLLPCMICCHEISLFLHVFTCTWVGGFWHWYAQHLCFT